MTSSFQQQAFTRKLIYIGVILGLFVVTLSYRYFVLQRHAEALALRETSRGDVELGGSALRLLLTGSRGVVVCALSYEIMEAHEKNQWNKEELIIRYLTKLLPHYIEPWLYHSWHLAYNVSVEEDRVRDRYYFMSRGIGILAEGERQNRNNPDLRWNIGNFFQEKIGRHDEKDKLLCLFQMSLIDPLERNPNRFYRYDWNDQIENRARLNGVPKQIVLVLHEGDWRSDKSFNREDAFRQEVQRLLTTDKARQAGVTEKDVERYTVKIEEEARTLKLKKFVAFAKRHPELVRRLREKCTAHLSKDFHLTPVSIIRYLDENRGIPSLFNSDPAAVEGFVPENDDDEEPHGHTRMLAADDYDRFPPLPLPPEKRVIPDPQEYFPDELNSDNEELLVKSGDLLDAFAAARTWFAYAQEPLPKSDPRRPGWAEPVKNPISQRMPKHMRSVLFRNCPARAQTFIPERLQREGWFDRWDLVEAFDRDAAEPLFTDNSKKDDYKVGKPGILKEGWRLAHEMWRKHGEENFLYVAPDKLEAKRKLARQFLERYRSLGLKIDDLNRLEKHPEGVPDELRDSFEAYSFVSNFDATHTVVNFSHFYYWTMAEQEDDALLSRRLFAEADVLTVADRRLRARKYEAALEIWKNILLRDPDLRSDGLIQDPLYEYQLKQLYNFNMLPDGGKAMKRELLAQDLIGLALAAPGAVEQRCLTLGQFEQFEKSDQEWPSATIDGPLDGKDQYGRPIIDESIKQICIGRFPDKAAVAGHPIPAPVKKPDGAGAPGDGRGRPGGPGGRGPGGRGPGPRGPGDR